MKIKILLLSLIFLPVFLFAQEFDGGLLGGFTATQLDGDNAAGFNKMGVIGGAFVKRKINDKWSLGFEIKYIEKGSRHTPDYETGDLRDFRISLDYIEIPLKLQYLYQNKVILEGGIAEGYLMSQTAQDAYNTVYQITDNLHKFETCSILGLGYKFTDRLWVTCDFSYSIFSIRAKYPGETWIPLFLFPGGAYNNLFEFTLYFKIN